MENQIVTHINRDSRYRVVFEQAASTKGVIGFKVEANGDDLNQVSEQAEGLLKWAREIAPNIGMEVK